MSCKILSGIHNIAIFRIGDEIAIPLVLSDLGNLDSVNRVIAKTGKLIDLNIKLFNRLASFTQDMETVQNKANVIIEERK